MLLAPALLAVPLVAAVFLTLTRPPRRDGSDGGRRLVELFLLGLACQCAHTLEEFWTGLHRLYPPLFGLEPLSAEFFWGFNVFWLGVWVLSASGVLRGWRAAYLPVWFFGLAMCLNGVVHPLLVLWVGGYFPGLVTAPVVGVMGLVVTRELWRSTEPGPA